MGWRNEATSPRPLAGSAGALLLKDLRQAHVELLAQIDAMER